MDIPKINPSCEIIIEASKNAGNYPGVYKMLNSADKIIYIGKAKNLRNRLASYSRTENMPNRLKMLVSSIAKIDFIITKTEIEALILESNLIKENRPFFNILLKDDKSYPYIVINNEDSNYPMICKHRSTHSKGKNFYGPYPIVSACDETLKIIQKTFLIRNCTDNFFNARKRPCLQYFIKRCSAPCMKKISPEEYRKNVDLAKNLLNGKDDVARNALVQEMRQAATDLNFEHAALIRDRISALSQIQSKQYAQVDNITSIDVIAIARGNINSVASISFFRYGRNIGTETFVIQNSFENDSHSLILESFIMQVYTSLEKPSTIITSHKIENKNELSQVVNLKIIDNPSGLQKKMVESCLENAQIRFSKETINEYKNEITDLRKLTNAPKINRIETYDNSHIMGSNACGAMIVFENGALRPNMHRKFNISKEIANKGDDIAMMKFILSKRFKSSTILERPDIIIIDGGHTQLSAAIETVNDKNIRIISITKQNNRKVGDEKIILEDGREIFLNQSTTPTKENNLLNFLIMLRNEAHRVAITFHRKKRQDEIHNSELDAIPTIGKKRKKALLEHFGAITTIKNSSIDDIIAVRGIDRKSAMTIFDFFNKRQK